MRMGTEYNLMSSCFCAHRHSILLANHAPGYPPHVTIRRTPTAPEKKRSRELLAKCSTEPQKDDSLLGFTSVPLTGSEEKLPHPTSGTRLPQSVTSLDVWTSVKLFVQMCCVTIPLSHGGVSLTAELIGVPVSALTKLQVATIGVIFEIIQILGVWVLVRKCTGSPWSIFKYRWDKKAFVQGCAQAVGAIGLATLIVFVAHRSGLITPPLEKPIGQQILDKSDLLTKGMGTFLAVVLGPFLEELMFRGLLLPLLADWLGIVSGILLSGALFSAWHMSPDLGFQRLVSGCVFGAGYYWSNGNLATSTLGHALYNLFIVVISCWP